MGFFGLVCCLGSLVLGVINFGLVFGFFTFVWCSGFSSGVWVFFGLVCDWCLVWFGVLGLVWHLKFGLVFGGGGLIWFDDLGFQFGLVVGFFGLVWGLQFLIQFSVWRVWFGFWSFLGFLVVFFFFFFFFFWFGFIFIGGMDFWFGV